MDCSVLQGRVSPYTLQTLLEATAALTHTYCGVLSTSSLGRGLAPPLQSVSHRRTGRPPPLSPCFASRPTPGVS
eukprot:COSAG01_NODE_3923_length_5530_cov_16.244338_4_plen_74_part_00